MDAMIDPAWKIGEIRQQIAVIDGKIALFT